MKKLDLATLGVEEMTDAQMQDVDGGWLPFVAGAIIGGAIYDVYKAACLAMIDVQAEHPEYYDGAVRSIR